MQQSASVGKLVQSGDAAQQIDTSPTAIVPTSHYRTFPPEARPTKSKSKTLKS